ncbi:hypothetical protein LTR36_002254 [Oleoguttula mirabilis]|uniref:DUF7907 domain-containing protein n=1 Tax=Oleoguttula mirabilis TaxID=1507867 RepID=A0AAV9JKT8_9PEZI|nr:hypothetical protein LTR36_002254 [Oleoguttula mirabilis]
MATFLLISALAALAMTAPTTTAPSSPAHTTSPNFRLLANVTSCDLTPSIQNWALTSYHVGAGEAVAVLTSDHAGRAFYVAGSPTDVRYGNASIFSDGGTPPFPEGLVVSQANETDDQGRRSVRINAGDGTIGVALAAFPNPIPSLTYGNAAEAESFGGWYACNTTLPYGAAIALYYRSLQEATPGGCADVTLLPECAGNVSTVAANAQPGSCFPSVAAIDEHDASAT